MRVHGLLLLDKPVGLSSNAALQRARRLFDADKAGHGGTLDPLASGLLPVLFGEACKLAVAALDGDKGYSARIRLGERTTTDDAEGEVVERRDPDAVLADRAALEAALARFRGPIAQVPPAFSALKRDGRPLYLSARAGAVVTVAPRPVVIDRLVLEAIDGADLVVDVACSKGTYVRALARDLGDALGCGAHLAGLVRTVVGRFTLAAASTLAELEALEPPVRKTRLIGLEQLVADWPRATITTTAASRFRQGAAVATCDVSTDRGPGQVLAVFADGRLIGLGRLEPPAGPPAEAPGGPPGDHAAAAIDARPLLAPTRVLV